MTDLIISRAIDPGKVVDLTLPLDEAAEGYQAMDERRAIKACFAHETVAEPQEKDRARSLRCWM